MGFEKIKAHGDGQRVGSVRKAEDEKSAWERNRRKSAKTKGNRIQSVTGLAFCERYWVWVVNDSNFLTIGFLGYGAYTCPWGHRHLTVADSWPGTCATLLRLFLHEKIAPDWWGSNVTVSPIFHCHDYF